MYFDHDTKYISMALDDGLPSLRPLFSSPFPIFPRNPLGRLDIDTIRSVADEMNDNHYEIRSKDLLKFCFCYPNVLVPEIQGVANFKLGTYRI
jgi:hypothetical protein